MLRLLTSLRKARWDLVSEAVDHLAASGSPLPKHEAEFLIKSCVNAYLVALSQRDSAQFAASMANIADREARAGNALRVEAVLVGLDLVLSRLHQIDEDPHGRDVARSLLEDGRERFLRDYLRAKAAEDERRIKALETFAEEAENVPSIIYSTDEDGRLTDISHLAAELLGYRKEDLLGQHYGMLMQPEDADRFRHFIQERRRDDRATRRARVTLRTADGTLRKFDVSSTGVYAADGSYIGTDGIARAVSGEAAQLDYQLDDQGRFLLISEDAAAALGFTPDELLGQHFSSIMDPRERERVGRMFGERRADDRAASRMRVVLTGRDGGRREFEISAVGRYDAEGRFVGTVGLGSDLSTRSEVERTVSESRRKYRAVFDQIGLGLCLITPDLIVRETNAWVSRRRRRPVAGSHCYTALYGRSERCEWCGLRDALHLDRPVLREDVVNPLDGRSHLVMFSPLRDQAGTPWAVIETVVDVTAERDKRERGFVRDKGEALLRLATGLAGPLDDLLTIIALKVAGHGDRGLSEALAGALHQVGRFERFTGAAARREATGDVNAAVTAVTEPLAASHPEIDVELDLLPTAPLVAVPQDELEEIVAQLVANAVEAMDGGGELTVETSGDPTAGLLLRLIDTGHGMTDNVARRVLDPFFTTRGPGHEGLGLTRCDGLVRSYGGSLAIATAPEAGTSVEIQLPTADPATLAGRAHQPGDRAANGPLKVALRVAAEPLADALREALAAAGHELVEEPGEVVIVDAAAAGEVAADRPVVVLCGVGDSRGAQTPRRVPLAKPFELDELLAALAAAAGEVAS